MLLKVNFFLLKTLTIVPTMLEMSSYIFAFAANLINTLKKKDFKVIVKAFRVLCLRKLLLLNESF